MTGKKKILVVDDEEDVLAYIGALLADQGFEVETARRADEAMEKMRSSRPDLVTLDILMPGETGAGLYREMKAVRDLARVPVVIVTGLQEDVRSFLLERGNMPMPEGYVSKPFSRDDLLSAVRKALARRP